MHCVRFTRDGLVYVCDRTNNRVQVFRKDGTFVSEAFFERETRLNGSVSELVFSPDPAQQFVYMVDGVNNELRIVDRVTNAVLSRLGRPGRYAGQFHVVHNVAVDQEGNVYTTEVNTGQRVQKFRRLDAQTRSGSRVRQPAEAHADSVRAYSMASYSRARSKLCSASRALPMAVNAWPRNV